jgi:DnaJ-class molecular chaperone
MLKLVGDTFVRVICPRCNGRGTEPCPRYMGVRTLNGGRPIDTPGEGRPMPCSLCKGAKTIADAPSSASEGDDYEST